LGEAWAKHRRYDVAEITVTVSGPVGCGKSAIAGEIEIALLALGVPVRFADEEAWQTEKNMTHADWADYIDMYNPSVVIVERPPHPPRDRRDDDDEG
jgi:hypothetical protein